MKLQEIRYQTQMRLPGFGTKGQDALKQVRIACVGLGGLGSPASLYLSASGVGTLGLIDGDRVELSNLHRQILFNNNDIGRPKVEAARDHLSAQNPETEIQTYFCDLNASNALGLLKDFDLILDCTDNFSTNYLINDAAVRLNKPVIYASVSQNEGRLA
ncbi:HesA/MoeB/ThiF family protein, partial [Bdellovibrionota bacterium FG-2]